MSSPFPWKKMMSGDGRVGESTGGKYQASIGPVEVDSQTCRASSGRREETGTAGCGNNQDRCNAKTLPT
jgi:hypothetical protein